MVFCISVLSLKLHLCYLNTFSIHDQSWVRSLYTCIICKWYGRNHHEAQFWAADQLQWVSINLVDYETLYNSYQWHSRGITTETFKPIDDIVIHQLQKYVRLFYWTEHCFFLRGLSDEHAIRSLTHCHDWDAVNHSKTEQLYMWEWVKCTIMP